MYNNCLTIDFDSEQELTLKLLSALFLYKNDDIGECTKKVFAEYDVSYGQ